MKAYAHNERVMSCILDDKARTVGSKVFVRHHEDKVTYEGLNAGSTRIANFLIRELGVKSQDKVAVILPNCVDFFFAQFGIAKAGAVMVPVNVQAKLELLDALPQQQRCGDRDRRRAVCSFAPFHRNRDSPGKDPDRPEPRFQTGNLSGPLQAHPLPGTLQRFLDPCGAARRLVRSRGHLLHIGHHGSLQRGGLVPQPPLHVRPGHRL